MKRIYHKKGQAFMQFVEFVSNDNKRLILVKSTRSILDKDDNTIHYEPRYYKPAEWFVLYDNNDGTESDMGVASLVYPKSNKALSEKSAVYWFNEMILDLDKVNFKKIEKNVYS
jgi:hypothetical protein